MIRIGKVVDVKSEDRTVRVAFPEADDLVSDWLKVVSTPPSSDAGLPEVGNTVLCLYNDEPNADGYVIGGL